MGTDTTIEWCDSSWNPWIGCTEVSVGDKGACVNCYARSATPTRAMRIGWGAGKPRHRTSASTWALPLIWERNASEFEATHGRRQRVFCASLADVFDNEVEPQWRADLFAIIRATPSLDWLLLTKRIGNVASMLPADWSQGYANVGIGATVVTRAEFDRDADKLRATPAGMRFLSMEPLLECMGNIDLGGIDWVIVGGESGRRARPMDAQWALRIRDRCQLYGAAFFFKQGSSNNWAAYKDFHSFPPHLQHRAWPQMRRQAGPSPLGAAGSAPKSGLAGHFG